jgi:putative DNA primase/helicase
MVDLLSPVSEVALLKALAWSEYLEGHMHRVYGLSSSIDDDNAIGLARKFGGQLKGSFTLRDVKQANWQGIGRDEDKALAAISVLLDHGYIIAEQRSTHGRPTIDYVINEGVIGIHG